MKQMWQARHDLIQLGMWSDTVLTICGTPHKIVKVGRDQDGLVVEWHYPGFKLTFARAYNKDVDVWAYGVQKIEEVENDNGTAIDSGNPRYDVADSVG